MERTNISADESNSAIGIVGEPIERQELELERECERARPETMIHRDMPSHVSAIPFNFYWQPQEDDEFDLAGPCRPAADATVASPPAYDTRADIGMGMDTVNVDGSVIVHHHPGIDHTSHLDVGPPPSHVIHNLPNTTTSTPCTSKGVKIHANDVLCGRGGHINSHQGNLIFRDWVAERKESYVLAKTKADKTRITSEIYQRVLEQIPPGRFLRKIAGRDGGKVTSSPYSLSGIWVEIDNAKALAKCSQALREGAPEFRAQRGEVQSPPSQRTSAGRIKKQEQEHEEDEGARAVPSHSKRKKPPPELQGMEVMPSSSAAQEAASMPPRITDDENYQSSEGLHLFSQDYAGHYTASVDHGAQGFAFHRTTKVPTSGLAGAEKPPEKWSSPEWTPSTTLRPFVSPGISPSVEARLAMDAMSFLPEFVRTDSNPHGVRPRLSKGHSLSSNDDNHSVGSSFHDPFASDSNGNSHKQEKSRSSSKGDCTFKSNHSTWI